MVASPVVTRAMQAKNGHVFVRFAFGETRSGPTWI